MNWSRTARVYRFPLLMGLWYPWGSLLVGIERTDELLQDESLFVFLTLGSAFVAISWEVVRTLPLTDHSRSRPVWHDYTNMCLALLVGCIPSCLVQALLLPVRSRILILILLPLAVVSGVGFLTRWIISRWGE